MNEKEFTKIVRDTKNIVLKAVSDNLFTNYYHAIDDVVQETYFRAYKSLTKNKFKGDSSISTWLYTIARNESLRMNTKLNREEKKIKKTIEKIEDGHNKEKDQEKVKADKLNLENLISKLPEKYKLVMDLVFQGMPLKVIAETLQLKLGTVKSRTNRGRYLLQNIALQEDEWKI